MALSAEDVAAACKEPDESTKASGLDQDYASGLMKIIDRQTDFIFQQTMLRVKDPKASLDFYTRVMGMRLLKKFDFEAMSFSLYFVGYCPAEEIPTDESEKSLYCFRQKATLELTHNWGSESDDTKYHNGNSDPRGFGHIGIAVPDVYKACQRFEDLGVKFIKTPDGGKMKGLAFIQDPDGYWIEILSPNRMARV